MSALTAIDMARQLGRWWARNSALALTFAEPAGGVPANIYAAPLPQASHRLAPGISIVPVPSAASGVMDPSDRMSLRITAVDRTLPSSANLIDELVQLLWPNSRPQLPREGTHRAGIFGAPTSTGTHMLWRAVQISLQVPPFTTAIPSPGGGIRTAATVEIHAVETSIIV